MMMAVFLFLRKWVMKFSTCMLPMRKFSTTRSALSLAATSLPPKPLGQLAHLDRAKQRIPGQDSKNLHAAALQKGNSMVFEFIHVIQCGMSLRIVPMS
jgi:hypothetical protein